MLILPFQMSKICMCWHGKYFKACSVKKSVKKHFLYNKCFCIFCVCMYFFLLEWKGDVEGCIPNCKQHLSLWWGVQECREGETKLSLLIVNTHILFEIFLVENILYY